MKRVIVPVASMLAGMVVLAGCASAPAADNGPLSPIGDMSQTGVNNGTPGPEHDVTGARPGIGGGVDDGPALPGGMHGSGGP